MRISDWSSDVCSSDLLRPARVLRPARLGMEGQSRRNVFQLEPAGVVRVLRPADHLTTARPRHESHAMPRFLIERDHPDAGALTPEQPAEAPQHSNPVIAAMAPEIQRHHNHAPGATKHP